MSGWIGVDLDGTLAHYTGWRGIDHIGQPVPAMIDRVKRWIAEGQEVKIFTARVACAAPDRDEVVRYVHAWLLANGLPALEVTCMKDFGCIEIWDDRAVQIVINTGRRADGQP